MTIIEVRAGCRLHFGLYCFGASEGQRNFGGVGVMLESPALRLRLSPGSSVAGLHTKRVQEVLAQWRQHHETDVVASTPPAAIEILAAPPHHRGLGVGTALGMSLAAGLRAYYGLPPGDAETLAISVGRGRRSAVGAHGFVHGGLIAEDGKLPHESLAPLDQQSPLPEDWRFLLATPSDRPGLSGAAEVNAFRQAPPVPLETRRQLRDLAREQLLPAAASGDFSPFSEAVYRFGRAAGECFSAVQGGPYNGPAITNLVHLIRSLGLQGVGQSSWGPTVYALCQSAEQAAELAAELRERDASLELHIAKIRNQGAAIERLG